MISVVIICNMKSGPLGNFSLKTLSTDWRFFFFFFVSGWGGNPQQLFRSPLPAEFGSGLRCDGGRKIPQAVGLSECAIRWLIGGSQN